jgi:hypothetical protein
MQADARSIRASRLSLSASERAIHCANISAVIATKRLLTALLFVPRASTASPKFSSERLYFLVATPTATGSSARASSGSVLDRFIQVDNGTSLPSRSTMRGRWTATRRPPRASSPRVVPPGVARREGVMLVTLAAESRPLGFEHRGEGLEAKLVHQLE